MLPVPDDRQNSLDPDNELVLPEDDELDQSRREHQKVELPERAAGMSSPLLRRVIAGEVKERVRPDRPAGEQAARNAVVRREVGTGSPVELGRSLVGGENVEDRAGKWDEDRAGAASTPGRPPDSDQSFAVIGHGDGEADGDGPVLAGTASPASEPEPARRRRRRGFDQEAEWQDGGRSPIWWLGGGILCVLMIGIVVLVMVRKGGFGETALPSRKKEAVVPATRYESLPIAEFVAKSSELLPIVKEVLLQAESGPGDAKWLRGGEESLKRRQAWRKRYPAPSRFRKESLHEIHASGNDYFAYLLLTGEREGFEPLMAYFVKAEGQEGETEDRMLLDWEATEGYSEVLVDEVGMLQDGKPRMMRANIRTSNFYTNVYPDERFRSYTIHHDDPGEWLWAYAERDSEVDQQILKHMMRRDGLDRHRRVTLKIAKGLEGSRHNQVQIREFVFGGWIEPSPRPGR